MKLCMYSPLEEQGERKGPVCAETLWGFISVGVLCWGRAWSCWTTTPRGMAVLRVWRPTSSCCSFLYSSIAASGWVVMLAGETLWVKKQIELYNEEVFRDSFCFIFSTLICFVSLLVPRPSHVISFVSLFVKLTFVLHAQCSFHLRVIF